jgi:hypothetical protein
MVFSTTSDGIVRLSLANDGSVSKFSFFLSFFSTDKKFNVIFAVRNKL